MKNHRIVLLLMVGFCLTISLGAGSKLALINKNAKLIDLKKAIGTQPSMTYSDGESIVFDDDPNADVDPREEKLEDTVTEPSSSEPGGEKNQMIYVRVAGEKIYCPGEKKLSNIDELKAQMRLYPKATFKLVDDYAEAETFREVLGLFKEFDIKPELETR